ncbi:hypothetical protein [Bdellovibrio sp. KM01]|uniref:hypothetical protein n=1 Tax=Bdellovibrio sp. KM01 TaxID=2748865 RepID=UPI0015E900D7|nr:hypothetical protein [Bdellovibrio sp. KM01]QLY24897.1 hypothetical protein HW988_15915 [Bdellovibrio sp. KM01]
MKKSKTEMTLKLSNFRSPAPAISHGDAHNIQDDMSSDIPALPKMSHNEISLQDQQLADSNINKFQEFRRPLPLQYIDNAAECCYNKEEVLKQVQPIEINGKGKGRFKMKQTNRFKGQWFQELYVSIQDRKVGHTSLLSEHELKKSIALHPLPEGYTVTEVLDAIRYRQREYRKSIMPLAHTNEELSSLTIESFRPALTQLLSAQSLNQTMHALKCIYLPFLKETYSSDVKNGLRKLKEEWNIKVMFLKNENLQDFNAWLKSKEPHIYHASDISKIRGLASLIFERSSNPIRTRSTKHSTFNPEIEDILKKFTLAGFEGRKGIVIISQARKAIKLAQITTADELKSTVGLEKIVKLNAEGKISDADVSRFKPFFNWLGEEYDFSVPGFFEKHQRAAIHELTPEEKEWFQRHIENVLRLHDPELKGVKRQLDLYRLLLGQLHRRGVTSFTDIRPSDFIAAAALGAKEERNLGQLRGLKGLASALVEFASQKNKWKVFSDESYAEFETACLDAIDYCGNKHLENLDLLRYKPVFTSLECSWKSFFEIVSQDFNKIALLDTKAREGTRSASKSKAHADLYAQIYENLMEIAHGPKCGNRRLGAVKDSFGNFREGGILDKDYLSFSPDDKRTLDKYTAYALQAFGCLRFRSESDNLVFFEKKPISMDGIAGCIYPTTYIDKFLGETTALVLQQAGDSRKYDVSYLVPLSTLGDEFIYKYLAVFNIKNGEKLFKRHVSTYAAEIKCISCEWFGSNVNFEDLKNGKTSNKALTTHRYRNVLIRAIEKFYNGHDTAQIQAIVAGHTLDRKDGSSTTQIYSDYIAACEKHYPTLRRIKDLNYKTEAELLNQQLQEKLAKLEQQADAHQEQNLAFQKENTQKVMTGLAVVNSNVLSLKEELSIAHEENSKGAQAILPLKGNKT